MLDEFDQASSTRRLEIGLPVPDLSWPRSLFSTAHLAQRSRPPRPRTATQCACGCGRPHMNTHIKRVGAEQYLWFLTSRCMQEWEKQEGSASRANRDPTRM